MSLEAIAALLGHRSPRMTLVYARISDENVAEQYFNATQAVEAEAATASRAPSGQASGAPRRLLANGHCTRPVELDCRFQTICEGCGFYQTSVEFVDILRRQRDDATAHADARPDQALRRAGRSHRRQRLKLHTQPAPAGRPGSSAPGVSRHAGQRRLIPALAGQLL